MKKPTAARPANKKGVIKRLLIHFRPCLPIMAAALTLSLVQVAATLLAPVITGRTIDYIIAEGNVDFAVIAKNAVILIILLCVAAAAQYFSSLLVNLASYRTVTRLRRKAFDRLTEVPLAYIDGRAHGDLAARVGSDVDMISDGLIQGFSQLFTGIVTIAGTLGFMLAQNLYLALAVVVITPLSLFVARFIARGCHNSFLRQAAARGKLSGLVTEMLGGSAVNRLFGYGRRAEKRFEAVNLDLKACGQDAAFYSAMVNPCTRFVNNLVYAAVCIFGAYLVIRGAALPGAGALTVGGLSCFLSYANQYTKPFNEITGVATELQTATSAAARTFELIETPAEEDTSALPAIGSVEGKVEFDRVRFSYTPDRPLIEDFSLTALPGMRVAIVGPTGCGKTTLINLLMRFYDPLGGEIRLDGTPALSVNKKSLRACFGMVLQDSWCFHGTVRENIAFCRPSATDDEVEEAARAAHAHGFISRLPQGYDTVIAGDGDNLSGGQKQLLSIARVMLARPAMLILDEATSAIDTRTEARVQDAFRKMMEGKTSFIVAHRLSTIRSADLILVMRDGNVVEKGTHRDLLARGGFYSELYNSQFEK